VGLQTKASKTHKEYVSSLYGDQESEANYKKFLVNGLWIDEELR
jgi:hypothetical protein